MSDYFGNDLDRAASVILFVCAMGVVSLIAWIVYGLVCWIF